MEYFVPGKWKRLAKLVNMKYNTCLYCIIIHSVSIIASDVIKKNEVCAGNSAGE